MSPSTALPTLALPLDKEGEETPGGGVVGATVPGAERISGSGSSGPRRVGMFHMKLTSLLEGDKNAIYHIKVLPPINAVSGAPKKPQQEVGVDFL